MPPELAVDIDSVIGNVTGSFVSGTKDDVHFLTIGDTDMMVKEIAEYVLKGLREEEMLGLPGAAETGEM